MKQLPIHDVLATLQTNINEHNRVILQAPPGAGKSTIVPLSLLDASWLGSKIIIMLEPRRMAARMVATQMAKLLGEKVGQRVGYQVKMERCYTKATKILVVTEAILVRMLQADQTLDNVAMVIFDEFHERSIHSDLSLALTLQVQELLRDDLKILLMSATLNAQELSFLLQNAPIVTSQGRSYDVDICYLDVKTKQPDRYSLNAHLVNAVREALKEDRGDILVFLAGVKEIKELERALTQIISDDDVLLFPLHASLAKKEQDRALRRYEKRKIILTTNIAQTSLTIEGVQVVIDSGLEKQSRYNIANAMDHLDVTFISQDAATQRAGRAGRLSHGKCYRMWHESKILQKSTKPEILRADLSALCLDLALWGVHSFDELQWLDIPSKEAVRASQNLLHNLNMIDASFNITAFGVDALRLGLHPRLAYMILQADDLGFAYEACLLSALISEKDIFLNAADESDIVPRFQALMQRDFESSYVHSYRAKEVIKQADLYYSRLKGIQKSVGENTSFPIEMLGVLLLFAYPDRLAKRRAKNDNRYLLSNAKGARLLYDDVLIREEFLVVANLHAKERDSFIGLALGISLASIEKYFASFLVRQESLTYNRETKQFEARQRCTFLELELYAKPMPLDKQRDFTELLVALVKKEGTEILNWTKQARALQQRVNFINFHRSFVDFSEEALLASLDVWLEPYLSGVTSVRAMEKLDVQSMLLGMLSWQERELIEELAPARLQVPSGSYIFINYEVYEQPYIKVKIQEMFGLKETPQLLNNTVALQIHLLTPAMRPIQITSDLQSFWENSYVEVRKELRGKYKKHYWPENPLEAVATNKTKKYM